jgi:hypothetical protein
MPERPRPDLDAVREAMRDRDEETPEPPEQERPEQDEPEEDEE